MHRLADDNEDNAPFQINYLDLGFEPNSYSAYQPLTRAPCWLEIPPLLWLLAPRPFRASPKTYLKSHWPSRRPPLVSSDVPLAGDDTASKSLEVTLARKDNHPRALNQA